MTVRLNPYLSFRDSAREAMTFYQGVLGGELDPRDVRPSNHASDDPSEQRQDHARASSRQPDGLVSWARTHPNAMEYRPQSGVAVSLSGDDEAALARLLGAPERGRHHH